MVGLAGGIGEDVAADFDDFELPVFDDLLPLDFPSCLIWRSPPSHEGDGLCTPHWINPATNPQLAGPGVGGLGSKRHGFISAKFHRQCFLIEDERVHAALGMILLYSTLLL